MQRIDPRPEPTQAQQPPQNAEQQQSQGGARSPGSLPTGFTSTGAQPHTQTFEEIYAIPENFLEIEVRRLLQNVSHS